MTQPITSQRFRSFCSQHLAISLVTTQSANVIPTRSSR